MLQNFRRIDNFFILKNDDETGKPINELEITFLGFPFDQSFNVRNLEKKGIYIIVLHFKHKHKT